MSYNHIFLIVDVCLTVCLYIYIFRIMQRHAALAVMMWAHPFFISVDNVRVARGVVSFSFNVGSPEQGGIHVSVRAHVPLRPFLQFELSV